MGPCRSEQAAVDPNAIIAAVDGDPRSGCRPAARVQLLCDRWGVGSALADQQHALSSGAASVKFLHAADRIRPSNSSEAADELATIRAGPATAA